MPQGLEKQQETKTSETAVAVMFHDSRCVLAGLELFRARGSAMASLSGELTVNPHRFYDAPSLPGSVNASPERRRAQHQSLSRTEKFSAEGPMARSDTAVSAANPTARSPRAASTVITTMTEQRRCFAA